MPKKYEKVLREVLNYVKPKPEEKRKMKNLSKKALKIARKEAKKFQGKAMLAGSLTRNTWLPDKLEFDIFLLFPSNLSRERLEEIGLKVGKEVINQLNGSYKIEFAEHPYVSGKVKGIRVDVVPCYEIESPRKLKSAVDRTPFHVRYIEKHLPLSLSKDVRLLKQFCRAHSIYGADAKTEGFSGYVCELLIVKYGKLIKAFRAARNWRPGEVIDIEKFYSKKGYRKLRRKFKNQPLILIDPIDKERNAAAAVSAESFYRFKKAAKQFTEKPSGELFFEREFKSIKKKEFIEKQTQRGTELILVEFKPPEVVPDILWPQLRKMADRLGSILRENDFEVLRKGVYTNESDLAVVLLEMEIAKLPMVQKRIGPRVFDLDDSKRFVEKYKDQALTGPFVENDSWVVEIDRKFLTAEEKLMDSLNEKVKILKAKGIPSHIAKQVAEGFEIISGAEKIMELARHDKDFGIFLRRYFEKESLAS